MTKEEYGFELFSGGLTVFEGVMTDSEPAKNIKINDDKTEITYEKNGYTVKLALTWDSNTVKEYKRTIYRNGVQIFPETQEV